MKVESGLVTGFEGETLTLGGGDGDVIIRAMEEGDDPDSAPEVRLSEEGLSIKNADKVRFVDPDTGEVYFDLDQEMVHFSSFCGKLYTHAIQIFFKFELEGEYDTIEAETLEAEGVFAPFGEDLFVKSDGEMLIQGFNKNEGESSACQKHLTATFLPGMEGVDIQGREVNFEAPQGEINIEAEREITIDGEVRGEIVVLGSKINF